MRADSNSGIEMSAPVAARRRLARKLYESLEFFDPSDGDPWEQLDDHSRYYFEAVIGELLGEESDLLRAMNVADDDLINRRAHAR